MTRYTLLLCNEKRSLYQRLSWLIVLLFFLIFTGTALFSGNRQDRISSLGEVILLAVSFAFYLYFRNTRYQISCMPFFFFSILGWIAMENFVFAGIAVVLQLLSFISTREWIVRVSKDQIRYPSFPAQHIAWKDLNQVLLKDGLLTIDFKSDKLVQQLVDENKTVVDEQEFNDFCSQQIEE